MEVETKTPLLVPVKRREALKKAMKFFAVLLLAPFIIVFVLGFFLCLPFLLLVKPKCFMWADLRIILALIGLKKSVTQFVERKYWTLVDWWEDILRKYASDTCFEFGEEKFTFADIDKLSNRWANWGLSQRLVPGTVVGFFAHNTPHHFAAWLGMAKIGCAVAMINANMRGNPLLQCLRVAGAQIMIYDPELASVIKDVCEQEDAGKEGFKFFSLNGFDAYGTAVEIACFSADAVSAHHRETVQCSHPTIFIYTSGTTGLPKAARISHVRAYSMFGGIRILYAVKPNDKTYVALPLYHSSGLFLGTFASVHVGIPVVVARKFSASRFFEDCVKYKATTVMYIGEICRYLVNTPPSPFDTQHRVRLAIGNGMRPDVWKRFQDRFNVPFIAEFYAATESNAASTNYTNQPYCAGRLPPLFAGMIPNRIVKYDVENDIVIRDRNGRCIPCDPMEPGQMIGLIDPNDPSRRFDGYTDSKSTDKKLLRDVFKKGDLWFATGDLLKRDKYGFIYFVDRIGDTFRWKGENVSTTQIEEILALKSIAECTVYGVQIPELEGRAGMAACVLNEGCAFPAEALFHLMEKQLMPAARLLFFRVTKELPKTGTFKIKKTELQQHGFDLNVNSHDELWFLDANKRTYVQLTPDLVERIRNGQAKL